MRDEARRVNVSVGNVVVSAMVAGNIGAYEAAITKSLTTWMRGRTPPSRLSRFAHWLHGTRPNLIEGLSLQLPPRVWLDDLHIYVNGEDVSSWVSLGYLGLR